MLCVKIAMKQNHGLANIYKALLKRKTSCIENTYPSKKRDPFWYTRYTTLKDVLEPLLFKSKKDYFAKFFEKNIYNSKKIWLQNTN